MAFTEDQIAKAIIKAETRHAQRELRKFADGVVKSRKEMDGATRSGGKFHKSLNEIASGAKAFKAALAIGALKRFANAAGEAADRSLRFANVMSNLDMDISGARRATNGMVTDFELARAANNAMQLGVVKTSAEFEELAATAVKLGARVGKDATTSIDEFTIALGRGSPKILDNFGIILKQEDAYRQYAKSIGVSVGALTEAQKAEAFMTVAKQLGLEKTREVTLQNVGLAASYKELETWVSNTTDKLLAGEVVYETTADRLKAGALASKEMGEAMRAAEVQQKKHVASLMELSPLTNKHSEFVGDLANKYNQLGNAIAVANDQVDKNAAKLAAQNAGDPNAVRGLSQGVAVGSLGVLAAQAFRDDEKKKKKKRGGRGEEQEEFPGQPGRFGDGNIAIDTDEINRLSANDRSEAQTEAFRREVELLEARREATSEHYEQLAQMEHDDLVRAGDIEGARLLMHEEKLRRIEEEQSKLDLARERGRQRRAKNLREEKAAARQRVRNQQQMAGLLNSSSMSILDTADRATDRSKKTNEQAIKIDRAFAVTRLLVEAGYQSAQSAIQFAALNPIKGTAHAVAAGIAVTNAGLAGSGAFDHGGAASGGGGGAGIQGGGFASGLGNGSSRPSGPQSGGVPTGPLSPLEEQINRSSPLTDREQGKSGDTIIIQGSVLGNPAELLQAISDAKFREGLA